jgi:hypothetical protein
MTEKMNLHPNPNPETNPNLNPTLKPVVYDLTQVTEKLNQTLEKERVRKEKAAAKEKRRSH